MRPTRFIAALALTTITALGVAQAPPTSATPKGTEGNGTRTAAETRSSNQTFGAPGTNKTKAYYDRKKTEKVEKKEEKAEKKSAKTSNGSMNQ